MDLTCPELAKIDVTSDYGSNDSSCSSQQEEGYAGICSLPDSVGKREETTCLRKSFFYHTHTLGIERMQYFVSIGRSVFLKKDASLGIISYRFNLLI